MINDIERWKVGQRGSGVKSVGFAEAETTPPKPYKEGTLLADMKSAAKFVSDPALREALKDAEGIGTSATRASTIEKLKRERFLVLEKGYIRSTPEGQSVVDGVPELLTNPGTTALWEEMLARIERGEFSCEKFVGGIADSVKRLMAEAKQSNIRIAGAGKKNSANGAGYRSEPLEIPCPRCSGALTLTDRWAKCANNDFTLFREVCSLNLSDLQVRELLTQKRIGPLNGFISKKKAKFSASLMLESDGKTKFEFVK